MKITGAALCALVASSVHGFTPQPSLLSEVTKPYYGRKGMHRGIQPLSMVLSEPPKKEGNKEEKQLPKIEVVKPLAKIEALKSSSEHLLQPLTDQMETEALSVSKDAFQILKYHGSYMQSNREHRGKGKDYQFMLRLKQPAGELPPELSALCDDLSDKYGQGDLRITVRQCFQIHGIRKGNLKTVISSIMNSGSSTVGACGDVSRNVMTTPAPFQTREYQHVREWAKVFGHVFRPLTKAFSKLWLDGGEPEMTEKWGEEVKHFNIDKAMKYDSGRGIILKDTTEPLYGERYLPRKFKIAVTVPGDNSVDIYISDIGCVVMCDENGELEGFNVMVGGGMGRSHGKVKTFPRVADHLGYVPKDDMIELMKSILASQRDHGNRDVRANARMKYLVHTLGIDNFRSLVESYFGKKIKPWRAMKEWKYNDWMGWWEQGDGKLFYGLHVDNGRVIDIDDFRLKTAIRVLVDKYNLDAVLSPTQSIIFRDIDPKDQAGIDAILLEHGLKPIEEIDPLARLAMACPALPLCGLAQTEAERRMPEYVERMRGLLHKMNLDDEEIMMRMTGCPNGCARPYMAELAFVGDGPKSYQIWLGGSPVLTRTSYLHFKKMKWFDLEITMEPMLAFFVKERKTFECFGDFCHRVGSDAITAFTETYELGSITA